MTMNISNYEEDSALQYLAQSLIGRKIMSARILEHESIEALLELTLDDARVINIGVSGSLHDEAYLIFTEDKS